MLMSKNGFLFRRLPMSYLSFTHPVSFPSSQVGIYCICTAQVNADRVSVLTALTT